MEYWELLNGLPTPVFVVENGVIAECNQAACTALGYRRRELLGKSFSLLCSEPSAHAGVLDAGSGLVQAALRCRNGAQTPMELCISSISTDEGRRTLIVCRSTVEERNLAERLEMGRHEVLAFLEAVDQVAVVQDRDGVVMWAHEAAGRSVSQPPEQLVGRRCYEVWHQRTARCENCPVARCWETQKPERGTVSSPDGRHWMIKGVPIFSDSGEMIAVAEIATDITDIENVRRELAEQKAFLRTVIDALPLHIYAKDREGRFVMLNQATVSALNASSEAECIGKTDFDFFPTDEANLLHQEDQTIIERGIGLVDVEHHFTDREGRERWYWTSKVPVRSLSGEVVGIVGSNRDVTDLKLAELALRDSEERYRKLVELSPVGVVLVVDRRVQYANPKALEMVGAPNLQAVLGMDVLEFLHPEYRDGDARLLAELEHQDFFPAVERRILRLDGSIRWVEIGGVATTYGSDRGVHLVFRDITQRKEQEAALIRLRQAIEQAGESVLIADRDWTVLYANPAFEKLTGWSVGEVLGKRVSGYAAAVVHDQALLNTISETVASGRTWFGEFSLVRKDRSSWHASTTVSPILDEAGQVIGFVSVMADVTDRVRLENELRESQKMEAVGRLAGGIAHDFNNLLTVIIATCDMLLRRLGQGHTEARLVRQVRDAGERAASLTRQLLAFSRKQVLEPRVLDLNAGLKRMEDMLRRLIGEHIVLRMIGDPELWPVKADPSQIDQVVMNLVVNAKDAMPMGGELTIETKNVEVDESYTRRHAEIQPGPYVMLAVSDTGHGMDQETLSRVFEPFFTTKGVGKGTGLGLSTVYGIVKQSGGHIWCYSEPGKGTTFKVYLPRAAEAAEAAAVRPAGVPGGTESILVVEDDSSVREVTCSLLRSLGYTVLEAKNAAEALELCRQAGSDLALMLTDVVMPEMSGRKLADAVGKLCPGLKVLYMSGYTDNTIVHHGVLDEGVQFVQKPFTRESLARKVREVLDRA